MKIENNLLKDSGVIIDLSPNTGGAFQSVPDTIVVHYTAGGSVESAVQTFRNTSSMASAHVVIGRKGEVIQMVPFDTVAWHAGKSQYGNRTGLNRYSIGIEIDNAGLLEKRGDKYFSWFNREYPESEVVYAVHRNEFTPRYWHAYTDVQIERVMEICYLLKSTFPVSLILGHEEISPVRKIDPGPAFPLDKIRSRVLCSGRNEDGEEIKLQEMTVTAQWLNIRELPDINSEKVAKPLAKNHKVRTIERKNGWVKVSTAVTGWVTERYLK